MDFNFKKDIKDLFIICFIILIIILLAEIVSKLFNLSINNVIWNIMGVFYFLLMGFIMIGMAKSMKEPIKNIKKDIDIVNKYYDELELKEKQNKEKEE